MRLQSWGNYPNIQNDIYEFDNSKKIQSIIANYENVIPYGNGRSYGDSALNKTIVHMKPYNYFLGFDEAKGILHCQAGVLLSEILEVFVPRGWFLAVTPGTKFITIGGAIASDVHGKNHHVSGSFSDSVVEFKLLLPNGEQLICSNDKNRNFFQATCGGMGLTGIIVEAKIQLQPIQSSSIDQIVVKTNNLKETFEAFNKYQKSTYTVAWVDCLAKNENIGKCLLMIGEHANDENLEYSDKGKLTIPCHFPSFVLNQYSVKAFNMLYYYKAKNHIVKQKVGIDTFFYPLDAINNWNRIYGKNGFTQYQFVLPLETSYKGLKKILACIADAGKGSFLAVLKLFGKGNHNWLSFPMEGYTLTLDFKIEPGLFELLNNLDKIVLEYGGRFYLAKDVRVNKKTFEKGYQNIHKFRELRESRNLNKNLNSLQSKRVGL